MLAPAALSSARRGGILHADASPRIATVSSAVSTRIADILAVLRTEFEDAVKQLGIAHAEKAAMEDKLQAQVAKMTLLQQTLLVLDAAHQRVRRQYEDELARLRRQFDRQLAVQQQIARQRWVAIEAAESTKGPVVSVASAATSSSRAKADNPQTAFPVALAPLPHHQREVSSSASSDESGAPDQSPGSRNSSAAINGPSESSSSKGSKLSWKCVYDRSQSLDVGSDRPVVELHRTIDHEAVVCCVRFSPNGAMLATSSRKSARVFDAKTGESMFMVAHTGNVLRGDDDEDADFVRAVSFSPDSRKLIAATPSDTIRVWDIATNDEGPAMAGHESKIYALDCVQNLVASGSGDHSVRLWDVRTGQCTKVLGGESGGPADGVTSVALSPDGRYIAAGSLDKVVRIWDTESSQLIDRCEGHSDSVYSIAFSPDGKRVVSGSLDRSIMLWDVTAQGRASSRPRMVFEGHKNFVVAVGYTSDGRWLMSGSKDRSFKLWDLRSARSELLLTGFRNSVISVAASPSTPFVATGSGDGLAVVWKYTCPSV